MWLRGLSFVGKSIVAIGVGALWLAGVALPWTLLSGWSEVPTWAGYVGAASVFPGLPLVWHLVRERRVGPHPKLRGRDRFLLRALTISGVSLGVGSVAAPSAVRAQWDQVEQIVHRVLPPQWVAWVQQMLPRPHRGLVTYAPRDASFVSVADMGKLFDLAEAADPELAAKDKGDLAACGVDVTRARVMLATRERPRDDVLFVFQAERIASAEVLDCLGEKLTEGEHQIRIRRRTESGAGGVWDELVLEFEVDGDTRRFDADVLVADPDTLVFVSRDWKELARTALDGGDDASSGPLAGALARVDRSDPMWGAVSLEWEDHPVDASGSFDVEGPQLRWKGSVHAGDSARAQALIDRVGPAVEHLESLTGALQWFQGGDEAAHAFDVETDIDGAVVSADVRLGWKMAVQLFGLAVSAAAVTGM